MPNIRNHIELNGSLEPIHHNASAITSHESSEFSREEVNRSNQRNVSFNEEQDIFEEEEEEW